MGQITDRHDLEKQMEKEGRLPPGQSLTNKFPVLHYGGIPDFDPQTWRFRIWGEVEDEISWSWEEFNQLPKTEVLLDIHCVTKWSKFDTVWKGISLGRLVQEGILKPKPSAAHVLQHAEGGYTTNLPVEVILQDIHEGLGPDPQAADRSDGPHLP